MLEAERVADFVQHRTVGEQAVGLERRVHQNIAGAGEIGGEIIEPLVAVE